MSRCLSTATGSQTLVSHGPTVNPPSEAYDTARYGDRPFPVIPVEYRDRSYTAAHTGEQLEEVINSPAKPGSTFNLYQEMSLGQLFPNGTVPSAGIATADFASYQPGFAFTQIDPRAASTCLGLTQTDTPLGTVPAPGTAVIGSLTGIAALMQIDSACELEAGPSKR